MFFFGPLSTHLPYVLLGVAYVLSVSFFSLKAYSQPEETHSESETTLISIADSTAEPDESTFYLDLIEFYGFTSCEPENFRLSHYIPETEILWPPPEHNHRGHTCTFDALSRPPPTFVC